MLSYDNVNESIDKIEENIKKTEKFLSRRFISKSQRASAQKDLEVLVMLSAKYREYLALNY